MKRPLVWFEPERPGPKITIHACWIADYNGETATFTTKDDAIRFCRRRWHRTPIIQEP